MKANTHQSNPVFAATSEIIDQWRNPCISRITGYFKRLVQKHQEEASKSRYKLIREMENRAHINQGQIDGLPLEEKMRLRYYKF